LQEIVEPPVVFHCAILIISNVIMTFTLPTTVTTITVIIIITIIIITP